MPFSITEDPSIAVLGAGIAGLTFAAFARRAGLSCTVYEQAAELGEVGAGIQLAPNAVRLLDRLDLAGPLAAAAVAPDALEMRQWRDGALIGRTRLGRSCVERFGAGYYTLHRADLHRGLVAAAGGPGTVALGRRCVEVVETPDAVELRFADGRRARAGLVVGADGIRSVVRRALAEDEPRYSGTTVYRGLIRVGSPVRPRVAIWLGPGQHCVWYPVSGGAQVSFAAVLRDPEGTDAGRRIESWQTPADPVELRRAFAGWHPDVVAMLARAESVTRWALHDRAPLASWHSDRLVVIGDAAHPMLPFGAHGANQAIESAVTLATVLSGWSAADRPGALAAYQRVRFDRLIQISATVVRNHQDHHLADGPRQRWRDRSLAAGLRLSEQDWLYGYDAQAAARAELAAPAVTAPAPTGGPAFSGGGGSRPATAPGS